MTVARAPARLLVGAVGLYRRWLSPLLPASCRFYPTCSEYAADAVQLHGVVRGSAYAVRRIACCHPFHPGGFDPVPPLQDASAGSDTH